MKAVASSQLAFEPALFPPWGCHFWKVSYSSSSQSWRGLPLGREGEKQPPNKGVSKEVAEQKCQDWHPGDLRSREKFSLVYLSSPGFLSLAISPPCLPTLAGRPISLVRSLVWVLPPAHRIPRQEKAFQPSHFKLQEQTSWKKGWWEDRGHGGMLENIIFWTWRGRCSHELSAAPAPRTRSRG